MDMAIWGAKDDILGARRDAAYRALLFEFSIRATIARLPINLRREILRLQFPEDGPATHRRSGSFSTGLRLACCRESMRA
jgi:hypothetical protein